MTTLAKVLATVLVSFSFSCNIAFDGVKGKGEVIKKEQTITKEFSAVKASRGLDIILVKDQNKKVIVEANENLHELIQVYVEENTLYVTSDKNIYSADEKNVYVSYDKINQLKVSSGASIFSQEPIVQKDLSLSASSGADIKLNVKAETLTSSVSSGAMINIEGKVNNHKASASSGANIRANDLHSLVSEAKATSGAQIKIYAKNEFTGKATSGADVVYFGDPQKVSENDNSGGNVRRH